MKPRAIKKSFRVIFSTQGKAKGWKITEPSDWYHNVFRMERAIWAPPPAVADVAIELLCKVRHVHPWNSHIVVVPSLMTARWRKKLSKVADLLILVSPSNSIWGEYASNH